MTIADPLSAQPATGPEVTGAAESSNHAGEQADPAQQREAV